MGKIGVKRTALASFIIAWLYGLRPYSKEETLNIGLRWDGVRWKRYDRHAALARKETP